jgi:hypothetical protein
LIEIRVFVIIKTRRELSISYRGLFDSRRERRFARRIFDYRVFDRRRFDYRRFDYRRFEYRRFDYRRFNYRRFRRHSPESRL